VSSTLGDLPLDELTADFEDDVSELCELAALICAAPIAGAHLLTPEGFTRSAWHGADPPAERASEQTPCAEVLATGLPLVIEDLSTSSKPDGTSWELGELRAYAGVPIRNGYGRALGTVCVFHTAPRSFSTAQLRGLELLAGQVARTIELAGSMREVDTATQERATAVAQLGRIEQRFHTLVEASPLAIFALDTEAKPVFVSDGCAMLFGTADGYRYDKTGWIPAVHEQDRARATLQWAKAVSEQTSIELQYRVYGREGQIQELLVSAAAMHLPTGEFEGWVGTVTDLTEQLEANRTLLRTQRASDRARADLEARNAELQGLARTKDTFLSAVSHEFRTPLTSITTFLQLLAAEDDLSDTQKQAVTVIARNAERLGRLVTDLLNVKETPGAVDIAVETIDLREVAAEAVAAASLRARGAGVELLAEDGAPVPGSGDPKRLAQVIDGLLDNALKFTEPGDEIVVRARSTPEGPVLEVADTGVGIDPQELERVFDRFYQGAAGRTSGSGSGLGLAIARRLLDAQGAQIEVRSERGQGTTMRILMCPPPSAPSAP
jgi:PAS domain S-box-containing protein